LGERSFYASSTSISDAIEESVRLLDGNAFDGQRKIIDVSGDGVDNGGGNLQLARERARAAGIAINGLAIESEDKFLTDYYRENVISGADTFVITADDFADYARAIKEKLLRELRPLGS
jgi:hypothetical protein